MHRLVSLIGLTVWCALFAWLTIEGWHRVWAEYQNEVLWLMLVMAFVSFVATLMLIRFLKLWKDVATGKISPRLAGRVVRNILADGIFFFKTGWKG